MKTVDEENSDSECFRVTAVDKKNTLSKKKMSELKKLKGAGEEDE
jgi:hypothetical protein